MTLRNISSLPARCRANKEAAASRGAKTIIPKNTEPSECGTAAYHSHSEWDGNAWKYTIADAM
jgi:hypothetical protein